MDSKWIKLLPTPWIFIELSFPRHTVNGLPSSRINADPVTFASEITSFSLATSLELERPIERPGIFNSPQPLLSIFTHNSLVTDPHFL